jgi:flagellar assembly protein FliH
MPLIKAAIATTTVRLSLRDFDQEARERLDHARGQADAIVEQALHRAGEIGAQAMAGGWERGYAQGMADARREVVERYTEEIALAVAALARAAAMLEASRTRLQEDALADVVRLAIAIAQRVTRRQGVIDAAVLTENLRDAVKQLIRRDDVRIAIHPSQRATLAEALAQLKLQWPTLEHAEIVEDETIAPGGCRVAGGQGEIDADLQAQLDRIAADLIPSPDAKDLAQT